MNEEINHSIEELKKAIQFSDTTCGIDFSYTVSIKDVKLTLKYIKQLQQALDKANETINKLCNDLKIQRILNKRLIEENFNSHSRNVKAIDKLDDLFDKPICDILEKNDSGWGDIAMYEESKTLFDIKSKLKDILQGKETK